MASFGTSGSSVSSKSMVGGMAGLFGDFFISIVDQIVVSVEYEKGMQKHTSNLYKSLYDEDLEEADI